MRNDMFGGGTTFVAMAYIIVVNPAILKAAGLPTGASTVATIVVAAAGSILMGLAALGITWQQRLGSVFVSGLLFLVITLIGLRGWLAKSISQSLKYSFAARHRPLSRLHWPDGDRYRRERDRSAGKDR